MLADALHLAQSPAFVVDGESVAPSATYQLAAARLDVEEEFVEALLDVARFADAERASIELVDAEPFHERRWALLMRAEAMQAVAVTHWRPSSEPWSAARRRTGAGAWRRPAADTTVRVVGRHHGAAVR